MNNLAGFFKYLNHKKVELSVPAGAFVGVDANPERARMIDGLRARGISAK